MWGVGWLKTSIVAEIEGVALGGAGEKSLISPGLEREEGQRCKAKHEKHLGYVAGQG